MCYCVCVFISHTGVHNIDLQPADSAALNLPSQLQPACGSAPTLASAKCHVLHTAHQSAGLYLLTGRYVGVISNIEGADSHNPVGETSQSSSPAWSVEGPLVKRDKL